MAASPSSFNKKLYEKYKNLKKRRFSEEEEEWGKIEADLIIYQSETEELIEELQNEIERLRADILSKQEEDAEHANLLLEERKKSKKLSEEVERLQNLLLQKNDEVDVLQSPNRSPRIQSREGSTSSENIHSPIREESSQPLETAIVPLVICQEEQAMPHCCRGISLSSGDKSEGCMNCVFQTLLKFLTGMEFSVDSQREQLTLSVLHQMSGYTFSLKLLQQEGDGAGELMYHVESLGTLERVALDWMKEDIVFSMSMLHVFFERILRVIGRR